MLLNKKIDREAKDADTMKEDVEWNIKGNGTINYK